MQDHCSNPVIPNRKVRIYIRKTLACALAVQSSFASANGLCPPCGELCKRQEKAIRMAGTPDDSDDFSHKVSDDIIKLSKVRNINNDVAMTVLFLSSRVREHDNTEYGFDVVQEVEQNIKKRSSIYRAALKKLYEYNCLSNAQMKEIRRDLTP